MQNPPEAKRKPKKPPRPNPISTAVTAWLRMRQVPQPLRELLAAQAPRRWTVYEPMALLPAGAFGSAAWEAALCSGAGELWQSILGEIGGKGAPPLTHLAVNEGIPLCAAEGEGEGSIGGGGDGGGGGSSSGGSNILRSPSGLRMLHGDFGPDAPVPDGAGEAFERALWVSARQNGIFQTWAPRWTMFSRGNVKEKARLLDFHRRGQRGSGDTGEHGDGHLAHRASVSSSGLRDAWAVDLYAGIGYFVFSYAKQGMRVLGWELNPWSVEGLRRGARGNGWSVKVVRGLELARPMAEILAGGEQIVVFLEDNAHAASRIRELRSYGVGLEVLHVNCGLLPTSDAVWRDAWDIAGGEGEQAWLHLHENVGVADIDRRKGEIEQWFTELATNEKDQSRPRHARVEHAELVKTYAPGVWHCVFDVYIQRSSSIT
ncbi:S-adenosyl-L-methionine-dependent methyltransferase [Biscogniauxia sp. FL1348]|nr:S-adenosyl-L-methionine-dependent methyltransferase [Biscogniauxia sp. FL1348]